MSKLVSRNVRFKLWSEGVSQPDWARSLASRTGVDLSICRDLVMDRRNDETLTPTELTQLSRAFPDLAEDGSDLRFSDLLGDSGRNVLGENLKLLFDSLEHGGKKRLAATFGINQTTISRWLAGATAPQVPALQRIAAHFGLPSSTDLRRDPIFLSLDPVSSVAKRHWVRDRLDKLSEQDLQELYPALRRMLEED